MEELVSGLGQALPGVVGGLMANQANANLAHEQMNFQREMASTGHQREVADLRAAGLNPILSAGGSGSPSAPGAMGTQQNAFADVGHIMQANHQMKQQDRQLDIAEQNADTAEATADANIEQTQEEARFKGNVNDSIESVLPYFKKGVQNLKTIPDALINTLFGPLSNQWQQGEKRTLPPSRYTNPEPIQLDMP